LNNQLSTPKLGFSFGSIKTGSDWNSGVHIPSLFEFLNEKWARREDPNPAAATAAAGRIFHRAAANNVT
jgi:hypothetical protein